MSSVRLLMSPFATKSCRSISKFSCRPYWIDDDGTTLVDRALAGDPPMLAINPLKTESEKGEQRGFANLLRGTFGMFRNTTAHEARINWLMTKEDAEDLFSLVSFIHRRLDGAHMPPRA